MKRPLELRKSKNDAIRATQVALNLYAETAESVPDIGAPVKRSRMKVYRPGDPQVATEADIQHAVLKYLRVHPKIAWVGRFNSGAATSSYNGLRTFIRFSTVRGLSDIGGQLKGGRSLWVECKRLGLKLTEDQAAFLEAVNRGGGLGFVATCIEDVEKALTES